MSQTSEHIIIPISPTPPRVRVIVSRRMEEPQNRKHGKCIESFCKCYRWFNRLSILMKIILVLLVIVVLGIFGFILYICGALAKILS